MRAPRLLASEIANALWHRIGAMLVTADVRFANALAATEHGRTVRMLAALAMDMDMEE